MPHRDRIVEAFMSNEIKKILLIDDAYDPPEINDEIIASLADFLNKENNQAICLGCDIEQNVLCAAITAANDSDEDNEKLKEVYRVLYKHFICTRDRKYDPGDHFNIIKEAALSELDPLATLCKCNDKVDVQIAGLVDGKIQYQKFRPNVLFFDYYLVHNSVSDDGSKHEKRSAREISINLLKEIITVSDKDIPAIVLMSSQKIEDVDSYRHEAGEAQILSLRFGFLQKRMLKKMEDGNISVDHAAADVFLDASQGYLFGKFLQQALAEWKNGAKSALDDFMREVGDLSVKDFAYLLRFRLREEGQPLSEYLEWFFGECLMAQIEKNVNWNHKSFEQMDGNKEIEEKIEGAFDGPSNKIAEFFHRVRINSHRTGTKRGYRLGDVYVEKSGGKDIRVVITPDCDLMVRRGKTKIKSVLTMGGKLNTFNGNSAADDFFLHEEKPYSVQWNPKDLETFPIDGKGSLHEITHFQFVGTLRPLYAQEMQRRALTDLSRVGLPVAPAFGIKATVTAWIRTSDASDPFKPIKIDLSSRATATIIPFRSGQKYGHRVLLRRRFVGELIDQLRNMKNATDAQYLKPFLKHTDKAYDKLLREGGKINEKGPFGIGFVIGDGPHKDERAPWLQIVLKISEDAMDDFQTTDPLDILGQEE